MMDPGDEFAFCDGDCIDDDGWIHDADGSPKGRIGEDGFIVDKHGYHKGRIDDKRRISDEHGCPSGSLTKDGHCLDEHGYIFNHGLDDNTSENHSETDNHSLPKKHNLPVYSDVTLWIELRKAYENLKSDDLCTLKEAIDQFKFTKETIENEFNTSTVTNRSETSSDSCIYKPSHSREVTYWLLNSYDEQTYSQACRRYEKLCIQY